MIKTNRFPLIILFVFLMCALRLVNRDFYYDELFSIKHFMLAPLGSIAGHYVNLNNHTLYSLVNAAYLRLIGVHDMEAILARPWVLRLPQVIFAASTLTLVYRFGVRFLNKRVAVLAVLLLATSIPFYYYSVAIRGYGLSMVLMMALIYETWDAK